MSPEVSAANRMARRGLAAGSAGVKVLTVPQPAVYAPRMKTLTLEEFQRDLPAALALVRAGETVALAENEGEAPSVALMPLPKPPPAPTTEPRRVGFLKGQITMKPDFKMTEEEFLGWEEVVPAADGVSPGKRQRVLGRLAAGGEFRFGPDFEMTDEELLGES